MNPNRQYGVAARKMLWYLVADRVGLLYLAVARTRLLYLVPGRARLQYLTSACERSPSLVSVYAYKAVVHAGTWCGWRDSVGEEVCAMSLVG